MSKTFTLFILLLLISLAGQGKKYTDGYIVTTNNDTVYCKIKLASKLGDTYDLYRCLDILTADGMKQTYRAANRSIRAFGFDYDGRSYSYALMKDGSNFVFACREETGGRLNLYSYCTYSSCGMSAPRRRKVWVIESRTLDAITINTGLFKSGLQTVRDFLYNDADLIPLYDRLVRRFSDIRGFVAEANQRYQHTRNDFAVSR